MMIREKIFNKLHRHRSSSSFSSSISSSDVSAQRFDFSFSNIHARQVPKGWDKLSVSLVSMETGKVVSKSGKASVRNGNCQWLETWSQSMWVTPDDISNKQEQCPFKFIVTMGSTRSSILGEAAVNPARYRDAKVHTPVSLPLRKCNHGTVLQLEIKCLTEFRDNKDIPMHIEEENVEYNDLEIKSEETGLPALNSYHSFGSTEDSLDRESISSQSDSHRPVNHITGRQESIDSRSSASCGSYSFCDTPKSHSSPYNLMNSGSGKSVQSQKDDFKQFSHDNTTSMPLATSSRNSFHGKDITSKELTAEAMMWERNARNLKIDLEISRKEFANQTQQMQDLKMELCSLGTERDGLMQEIKQLELLLHESIEKEKATDSLILQVKDMDNVQKILKEELRNQKEANDGLSIQLSKTQESNLQLVSILQEMEETVEKQKLEIKNLLEKQKSHLNLENTTFHLEQIIREKNHEIELQQAHRTQALIDCEEKWKSRSSEQEKEIAYLKAELSRLLIEKESESIKARLAADCDLIKEYETIMKKLLELERDCEELTEENLELLYKLQSMETSSTSGSSLSSSSIKGQLSEQSPDGSEFEVIKGELLFSPFQDDMVEKKIIAETAAFESKQKTCNQDVEIEFHSQVDKDKASKLNTEINSCCFEVLQNCESGCIEDMYTLFNTLGHTTNDEQAKALLKQLFQLLRYRFALCLDGSKCIEDETETTIKDVCEVEGGENDDLPKENTPCSCCQRLEDLTTVLEAEVQNLSTDNLAKSSEIQELKTDCLKKDAEIKALLHHQNDLRTQISDLQMSKCQMEERMESMEELSATSKSLDNSRDGLMLSDQCTCGGVSEMALKMKFSELESDKYELELNLHELEEENVDLSERVSGLEAQLRHLTDSMEFNRLELQHSGNRIVNLQDKIRGLEDEKESQKLDMKEKLLEMQRRWLDAQEECEYLKKVHPNLQATTESLMEECRLLQNLNAGLRQQKLKLLTSHNVLEAELRRSQYSFSTCLKRIEFLEAKFSSVMEEIESKEKILKFELDGLHLQHTEKLIVEESMLHEMSLESSVEVEKLQKQVQTLMMQMSDLMSDLGTSKAKEGTLAANCEKLLRTMEHLASNEENLKCAINDLESKLLSSDRQMLQMTEENSSLKLQLQKVPLLQEEVLALKGELSEMKFESERSDVTQQLIYEDYEELKAEKVSLLGEISRMDMAVAEAEECKYKKIALEEKVLRLEGDLVAKEVMCAKVSELKNELCQLRRANSQFLWNIKSLQLEKDGFLKQVKSLEEEMKRKRLDDQKEADNVTPTLEEIALLEAQEEDFSKHQGEIITQDISHQDDKKESNYYGDLQDRQKYDNKISQFEAELQELRDRYLHMSLKYAEVEDQREQLVMALKAINDQKTAKGSRILDNVSSFW